MRDLQDPLGCDRFLASLKGNIAGRHLATEDPVGPTIRAIVRLVRETMRNVHQELSGSHRRTLAAMRWPSTAPLASASRVGRKLDAW